MNAIVTCNIGDIDEIVAPVPQSAEADYYCYTEPPFPLPQFNDRLKGKYIKINTHRFLKHDNIFWIDGRVQVTSPHFVSVMEEHLRGYDIVIARHYERSNVFEEIDFIQTLMQEGNKYLLTRYENEPFDAELSFYKAQGLPADFPLFSCNFFARRNHALMNNIFNEWWLRSLEFTCFDQAMFSYIAWKFGLKIKALDYSELLEYVTVVKHKTLK